MTLTGGIDLGGTKIEASVFDENWQPLDTRRLKSPHDSYEALLDALNDQINWLCATADQPDLPVGLGIPGIYNAETDLVTTANLPSNGRKLRSDLSRVSGHKIAFGNDCDFFALSEAVLGAGKSYGSVFGLIIGTGVGGGYCRDGHLAPTINGASGEVGHLALPASVLQRHTLPVVKCGCGRIGCYETYLAGPGLARIYSHLSGVHTTPPEIIRAIAKGDTLARQAKSIWREIAAEMVMTLQVTYDPDCVVLGGGLSNIPDIADGIAAALDGVLLSGAKPPAIRIADYGDSSGTRGAALAALQLSKETQ